MLYFVVVFVALISHTALSYSQDFFCTNSFPSHEPRFDRDFLNSIDISFMGGKATKAKNKNRNTTSVLDVYGTQDLYHTFLHYDKDLAGYNKLTNDDKTIVKDFLTLAANDAEGTLGKISFNGKFSYLCLDVSIIQNLISGFFLELSFPFQKFSIKDIDYKHLNATTDASWNNFNQNLTKILSAYDLSATSYSTDFSIGDVTILGGWTNNSETSEVFDFFDMSLRLGVSIPTSKSRNTFNAFAFPTGYNNHVGIPVVATLAWGLYDWLTVGTHVKGHYFLKTNNYQRVKTHSEESGFITLGRTAVQEKLGNLWSVGTYFKADHIIRGFSLQLNYNYTVQENTQLSCYDVHNFSDTVINSDERLKKWSSHALYWSAEYDFAQDGQQWNPHIKVFYGKTFTGTRSFLTQSGGFTAGAYIIFNF